MPPIVYFILGFIVLAAIVAGIGTFVTNFFKFSNDLDDHIKNSRND